jgi:hypothetical protein
MVMYALVPSRLVGLPSWSSAQLSCPSDSLL